MYKTIEDFVRRRLREYYCAFCTPQNPCTPYPPIFTEFP